MDLNPGFNDVSKNDAIAFMIKTLNNVHDPDAGYVGRELLHDLDASGCTLYVHETRDENDTRGAIYTPFARQGAQHTFQNQIDIINTDNEILFTLSFVHDATHALAWQAPILHASPYNIFNPNKPNLVLCPEDWIRMVLLTEQDAFAKQRWFSSIGKKEDALFDDQKNKKFVTQRTFDEIREDTQSLETALIYVAHEAMNAWMNGNYYVFGHHYTDLALDMYEGAPQPENHDNLIFVRMDEEDLLAAGRTIGPNLFHDKRLYGQESADEFLTPKGYERLRALRQKIGYNNKSELRSFRDVLAEDYNITPDQFAERSKTPISNILRLQKGQDVRGFSISA